VTFYGVEGFDVEKLDMQGATVTALVRVDNPNNYKIKVSSSDADLLLNGNYGGKATLIDPLIIPAKFKGSVKTKMKAEFEKGTTQILPIFVSIMMKRSVDIQIKGTLKAKSFLIGKNIDFDITEHAEF
jgi:LEA14-like dessication related protein